ANGTAGFGPGSLQTDATNVYWSSGTQQIYRCAKSGCGNLPTTVLDTTPSDGGPGGLNPILMGVDAQWIYFYDTASSTTFMYKMPLGGGTPTQVGPQICTNVNAAQLVGKQIYITCADGTIGRFDPVQNV